jgi:hypothetical protein
MGMLKIVRWEKWQSYRTDRGTPPWIKVHRNLLTNAEWSALSDAEKGQLVSIWIAGADKDGYVTNDLQTLRKQCQLTRKPNIKKFIELGFLDDVTVTSQRRQDGVKMASARQPDDDQMSDTLTSRWRHGDAPETETETETETEKKREEENPDLSLATLSHEKEHLAYQRHIQGASLLVDFPKEYPHTVKLYEIWTEEMPEAHHLKNGFKKQALKKVCLESIYPEDLWRECCIAWRGCPYYNGDNDNNNCIQFARAILPEQYEKAKSGQLTRAENADISTDDFWDKK